MAGIMDATEALNRAIVISELNAEGVAASRRVYFILAMLLEGTALLILKQAEKGNGLECWRHLNMRYEGVTDNRLHVMLQGILRPTPFPQDARGFEASLSSWELLVQRWETMAVDRMNDSVKRQIIMAIAPADSDTVDASRPSHLRQPSHCRPVLHGVVGRLVERGIGSVRRSDGN